MRRAEPSREMMTSKSFSPKLTLPSSLCSCGHQGSEMFINFINPMYPAQDIMSGSCNFRVVVSNPSVCQVSNKA